jgi:hypothetical protein
MKLLRLFTLGYNTHGSKWEDVNIKIGEEAAALYNLDAPTHVYTCVAGKEPLTHRLLF